MPIRPRIALPLTRFFSLTLGTTPEKAWFESNELKGRSSTDLSIAERAV
jgi:hypothetical protein